MSSSNSGESPSTKSSTRKNKRLTKSNPLPDLGVKEDQQEIKDDDDEPLMIPVKFGTVDSDTVMVPMRSGSTVADSLNEYLAQGHLGNVEIDRENGVQFVVPIDIGAALVGEDQTIRGDESMIVVDTKKKEKKMKTKKKTSIRLLPMKTKKKPPTRLFPPRKKTSDEKTRKTSTTDYDVDKALDKITAVSMKTLRETRSALGTEIERMKSQVLDAYRTGLKQKIADNEINEFIENTMKNSFETLKTQIDTKMSDLMYNPNEEEEHEHAESAAMTDE
jgi:hypothetical protein